MSFYFLNTNLNKAETNLSNLSDYCSNAFENIENYKQVKLVTQKYETTTVSNYCIVSKEGYVLVNAYNIASTSEYYVKGINKSEESSAFTNSYTIIIGGANNSDVALFLVWAKE